MYFYCYLAPTVCISSLSESTNMPHLRIGTHRADIGRHQRTQANCSSPHIGCVKTSWGKEQPLHTATMKADSKLAPTFWVRGKLSIPAGGSICCSKKGKQEDRGKTKCVPFSFHLWPVSSPGPTWVTNGNWQPTVSLVCPFTLSMPTSCFYLFVV